MKKIALFLVFTLLCGLLCGCAAQNPGSLKEADLEKFVTLGEYKGLTYTPVDTTVSEYAYTVALQEKLADAGYGETDEKEITKGKVQIGDTANIDYVGKKDGVAFEGGTAQGYDLGIGSGSFIAGFEEGLVGVEIGTTVDLNLTFPANYGNAELAGADVVFTVTVHSVTDRTTYPELTDAVAKKADEDCKTAKELTQKIKDELKAAKEEDALSSMQNELWGQVMGNTTFADQLPKTILENTTKQYEELYTSYGMQNGYTDLASFLSANGMTQADLEEMAVSMVKQQLAAYAIAEAEGYQVSDEEFNATAKEFAEASGYDDIDEYVKLVGEDPIRDQIVMDYAVNVVTENAKAK